MKWKQLRKRETLAKTYALKKHGLFSQRQITHEETDEYSVDTNSNPIGLKPINLSNNNLQVISNTYEDSGKAVRNVIHGHHGQAHKVFSEGILRSKEFFEDKPISYKNIFSSNQIAEFETEAKTSAIQELQSFNKAEAIRAINYPTSSHSNQRNHKMKI